MWGFGLECEPMTSRPPSTSHIDILSSHILPPTCIVDPLFSIIGLRHLLLHHCVVVFQIYFNSCVASHFMVQKLSFGMTRASSLCSLDIVLMTLFLAIPSLLSMCFSSLVWYSSEALATTLKCQSSQQGNGLP